MEVAFDGRTRNGLPQPGTEIGLRGAQVTGVRGGVGRLRVDLRRARIGGVGLVGGGLGPPSDEPAPAQPSTPAGQPPATPPGGGGGGGGGSGGSGAAPAGDPVRGSKARDSSAAAAIDTVRVDPGGRCERVGMTNLRDEGTNGSCRILPDEWSVGIGDNP